MLSRSLGVQAGAPYGHFTVPMEEKNSTIEENEANILLKPGEAEIK